jgi:Ca2+-binding RTX toxin-like protein
MAVRAIAVAATVGALGAPTAATAATVHTEAHGPDRPPSLQAVYDAAPGEANRVTVTVNPGAGDFSVRFHDAAATVDAGHGCVQAGPHGARCFAGYVDAARVHLGDGDDTLTTRELKDFQYYFELRAYGGDGADTLAGSLNWDFLYGGPGADRLSGGRGEDWVVGGPGSDRIAAGPGEDVVAGESVGHARPPADDEIDGGRGEDVVVYHGGHEGTHVDLARHGGGAVQSEHDRLDGLEDASLAAGAGTLAGDDRVNRLSVDRDAGPAVLRGRGSGDDLSGGDAADAVYGGQGWDYVEGGGGTGDLLRGGPGDDTIVPSGLRGSTHRGWALPVHCGRGHDVVHDARRHDVIAHDCEDISSDVRLGMSPRVRRIGDGAVELSVHRRGPHTSCRYAIELRAPFPQRRDARPRRIGLAVFRLDRKTWRRIRVRLNGFGRRLAGRSARVPVWVRAGVRETCGSLFLGRDGFTALL